MAHAPEAFMRYGRLVASVFKKFRLWEELTPWYLNLLSSEAKPITKIDFLNMYPTDAEVTPELISGLVSIMVTNVESELVEAVVTSRLAKWNPETVRALFFASRVRPISAMLRRALGLSAAHAGVNQKDLRRFLRHDDATYPTAAFLDAVDCDPIFFPVAV